MIIKHDRTAPKANTMLPTSYHHLYRCHQAPVLLPPSSRLLTDQIPSASIFHYYNGSRDSR